MRALLSWPTCAHFKADLHCELFLIRYGEIGTGAKIRGRVHPLHLYFFCRVKLHFGTVNFYLVRFFAQRMVLQLEVHEFCLLQDGK